MLDTTITNRGTDNDAYLGFSRELDEAGFCVWRKLFPEPLIDSHVSGYQTFVKETGCDRPHDPAAQPWHFKHHPTLELIFNDQLISFLRYRFDTPPVAGTAITSMYSFGSGPHADSTGFIVDPRGGRLRIWIALEDVHPDAGPIYFVPGSHRAITMTLEEDVLQDHPEIREVLREHSKPTTVQAFNAAFEPVYRYVNERVEKSLAALDLPKIAPALKKGDAVIFDVDTIHGSVPQNRKELTRKCMMVHWTRFGAVHFGPRYYWGPSHDFRCKEYAIDFPVIHTPFGYRRAVEFEEFKGGAFRDDYSRPVVKL